MTSDHIVPGSLLAGRFEVERLASSGGMGDVYRAVDRVTGIPVALKFVRHADPMHLSRFEREARALAQFHHPGIVRYIAHGSEPSVFLAMEWLDGEDLSRRLSRGPLSIVDTLMVAKGVTEALAAAHVRGIVHRDIKPSNIFLSDGRIDAVKVLDFGVAQVSQGTRAITGTGQLIGTLGYMAPEQALNGRTVTAAVDVYSLGCVLFECITGTGAFGGEWQQLLSRMLTGDPPRVRDIRKDAPLALDDLVSRMLQRDPSRRATLGTVAADVATFLTQDDVLSGEARRHPSIPAVTGDECGLVAVVVSDTLVSAPTPSMIAPTADTIDSAAGSVVSVAAKFGGELTVLPDGGASVVLSAGGGIDLATHAAKCALAMREAVGEASIAIATGRGDPVRKEVVSEIGERASDLASGPSSSRQVRLDPSTAALVDARFVVVSDGGDFFLAGEREHSGLRKLLGKATPCYGRERDLAMLNGLVAECLDEPLSTAIVVTGNPGVGKSRIRHEIVRVLETREEPPEVWLAQGDPTTQGVAYGMLGQLVRRMAGISDGDLIEVRRQKLLTRVGRHLPIHDAIRVSEFLGDAARAQFSADDRPALRSARCDPGVMAEQLRRAWDELIAAEVQNSSLAIVLEDLQWGDLQTIRCIDSALRNQRQRPLLVLSVARPEVHEVFPGLFRDRRVHEVRLAELTPSASRRLVQDALGPEAELEVVESLVERSHGNAFFLEELVRGVAEGCGALPAAVLATAQARLQRLEPSVRRILRAASVFGTQFWLNGVSALVKLDPATEVRPVLENLIQREVIMAQPSSRFGGDEEYVFRQALVRDAAYDMLTERDRTRAHATVADWLEANGEHDPAVLADHLERSGERHRAVVWYLWAAEQAFEKGAVDTALLHADRGIACGAGGAILGELTLLKAEARDSLDTRAHLSFAETALELLPVGSAAWARASAEVISALRSLGDTSRLRSVAQRLAETPHDSVGISHSWARARAVVELLECAESELASRLLLSIAAAAPSALPEDIPVVGAIVEWLSAEMDLHHGNPRPLLDRAAKVADVFESSGNAQWAALAKQHGAKAAEWLAKNPLADEGNRTLQSPLEQR